MRLRNFLLASALATVATVGATAASASSCVGVCGTLGANGVVTAPPIGGAYGYVTTAGGVAGAGSIGIGSETNGSEFISDVFSADLGSELEFYFNYVTSDGSSFVEYGFAELLTSADDSLGFLFTARTTPSGDTSPGFGLPTNISTLTPTSTPIIGGAPTWSPLGGSSGSCWAAGCGYTGWIQSNYTIGTAGDYKIRFGVTNWDDTQFDSGLAFAGLTIDGDDIPVSGTPEPATWAMMLMGFGAIGAALRSSRRRYLAVA